MSITYNKIIILFLIILIFIFIVLHQVIICINVHEPYDIYDVEKILYCINVHEPYDIYDVEKILYCFWTGDNKMSSRRKDCFEKLNITGFKIVLVTKKNLNQFIKKTNPLHPAYKYLSETHKADYLRTYFMHFYGGAYSDIKNPVKSWENAYYDLINDKSKLCNGMRESSILGVPHRVNIKTKLNFSKLIRNSGYIFRKQTSFTTEWYDTMMKKMDSISDRLKKYPSKHPQQTYSIFYPYPLRWAELLGEIFHPICYKYSDRILQTVPDQLYKRYR
jgi:hypothetical protein